MFSVSHCRQQPRTRVLLIQSDPTQAPFQDKPQIWLSTRTWRCGFKCVEALLSGRINELSSLINTWRSPVLFHNSDTVNNSKYNSRGSEVTSMWSKALQGSRCSPQLCQKTPDRWSTGRLTAPVNNARSHIHQIISVFMNYCAGQQQLFLTVRQNRRNFVCKLQKSEASKLEKHPGGNTGRENRKPAVKYLLVETLLVCQRPLTVDVVLWNALFWNDRKFVRTKPQKNKFDF